MSTFSLSDQGRDARTLGHAAIHQAAAGSCRVCDLVRDSRPELFTRPATETEMHAFMCEADAWALIMALAGN
jgi:hypothetical protein